MSGQDTTPGTTLPKRYRLERAGIHNVWQYDDHVFHFADGRLLLRGRNGAGKSKALEMLLPFLLDGDARRLDTTGTSRTSLRWLMLEGRTLTETAPDSSGRTGTDTGDTTLGYLWVEFARRGEDDTPQRRTLGAAIAASPAQPEARAVFFVTDRRVGEDLALSSDGRPLSIERLRTEVGHDNCYDTAVGYRARVMRDLFGLDDPMRYRNLIHLLYRLRRPTVGERLEAGELVSVLAEALPPMDDAVLDEVARNITDLDAARARLTALRAADERTTDFLGDYRGYLHRVLRDQSALVRTQIDAFEERDTELARLETDLDALVSAESAVQEERDRLRRARDTAASDATTLDDGNPGGPEPAEAEQQARYAAVSAYIRAAEAAWAAAKHALSAEHQAHTRLAADSAAVERGIGGLRRSHLALRDAARAAGLDPAAVGDIPQTVRVTLAPRESVTHVNLEGLEQAAERPPVHGIEVAALRTRLAELHDRLSRADATAVEREATAADLYQRALALDAAERREAALDSEAEWGDSHVERARQRERAAIGAVRAASAAYADDVREWSNALRAAAPDSDVTGALDALEERVELPLDDTLRVLPTDTPEAVARAAHAIGDPLLHDIRDRRDAALGDERDLAAELDDLAERQADDTAHITAPRPAWATAPRHGDTGTPLHLAVDFAERLTPAERAGLEAALEASGLLAGLITPDGTVVDPNTRDLLLSPGDPLRGHTLLDVLTPLEIPEAQIGRGSVVAILASIRLDTAEETPDTGSARPESWFQGPTGPRRRLENAVALDGRWRLGVAGGSHHKAAPEYIGAAARAGTLERHRAKTERRIEMAKALLAEAEERRAHIDNRHDSLIRINRSVPSGAELAAAWAALDNARAWLADAVRDHGAARAAADAARKEALTLRAELAEPALEHGLPGDRDELAKVQTALGMLRVRIGSAHRDLEVLAGRLEDYHRHAAEWDRARADRTLAEDARTAAIGDMITVRRETELTDRARAADPDQIGTAVAQVRARVHESDQALPELERTAQRARDDRVAAETRHGTAVLERAEQARRALAAGAGLRALLATPSGEVDSALLAAAGLPDLAAEPGPLAAYDEAEKAADLSDELTKRVRTLGALIAGLQAGLDPEDAGVDDSGILRGREELHRGLAASVGARTELTEPAGLKRLTVHDDHGSHDITEYAERLRDGITEAEETAAVREEEAYERHLLGELAEHLSRQIDEARELIATMNSVLGDITTSQGLGVRLDWRLAPDADEDIHAVVPLLRRPAEKRTRVETTRLRDALRRCIEAIRRLDPTATGGAQLRAALDYRSWFAFTVYVTDAAHPERERRLTHRTALSQGEQRVIAYLVLFAAAAAQFGALALDAPQSPRLILLDDAFAKVDEPTHGRLLGMLVELDLDFVLTSERVWGCFPSVPRLHIYECLRDPAEPGIATLHFTWDGDRRRLNGV